MRRLAFDGCCHGAWWDAADADRLYTIDGTSGQRAVIFTWDTDSEDGNLTLIGEAPPPFLSPDGTHELHSVDTQTRIRRIADGAEWAVETGGLPTAALSADNSRLMWQLPRSSVTASQADETEIWISDADGANPRAIVRQPNISAQWLDGSRLLLSARDVQATALFVYDTVADETFQLGTWERLRSLSVAPGGGRLSFYLSFQTDMSGIYTIETRRDAVAQRLDWFGAWAWRDANSAYYLPFDAVSPYHALRLYDFEMGDDHLLIDPNQAPFLVADGDWSVSPDGDQIAFMNALDNTLWLIDVP